MLQIRIGRNGESFYGQVLAQNDAATFFCTKKDNVINPKQHTVDEACATYKKRVLDDGTRGYQEVVALDFHPNTSFASSKLPPLSWAQSIAEYLLSTTEPRDAASFLEIRLRGLGRIAHHHPNASSAALVKAMASIRGPVWIF